MKIQYRTALNLTLMLTLTLTLDRQDNVYELPVLSFVRETQPWPLPLLKSLDLSS